MRSVLFGACVFAALSGAPLAFAQDHDHGHGGEERGGGAAPSAPAPRPAPAGGGHSFSPAVRPGAPQAPGARAGGAFPAPPRGPQPDQGALYGGRGYGAPGAARPAAPAQGVPPGAERRGFQGARPGYDAGRQAFDGGRPGFDGGRPGYDGGSGRYQGAYDGGQRGGAYRDRGQAFAYAGRQYFRYRAAPYRYPSGYGAWAGHVWRRGEWLPRGFISTAYFIDDWSDFGLWEPDYGFQWVRVGGDAVLIDLSDGRVVDVVPGVYYY